MSFADRIKALFRKEASDEGLFDDLADLLVEGDLGPSLAISAAEELRAACREKGIAGDEAVRRELKSILMRHGRSIDLVPAAGKLNIFLMLGVNGVGKTTTCAKLADYFMRKSLARGVILAAGDTFRAAAADQLQIHGRRLGIRVVAQAPGADPGAVLWDAIDAARSDGADLVIADTAGRMHTRNDLMRELGKMDKIVSSRAEGANYRRLLVVDSTTGQNGLRQAETFGSAVRIDGVVLTKQDSTAKGGMAIALAKECGLPTAFVGTGEGYGDIAPFSLDGFLDGFLGL
ncbi:MAG TPA: signal recognition particle-docking protein FtsY [Rectinemataceae bacterium]|nr:signal recognition particle-docking protein FtsY [Rectinemataceae bacterium]